MAMKLAAGYEYWPCDLNKACQTVIVDIRNFKHCITIVYAIGHWSPDEARRTNQEPGLTNTLGFLAYVGFKKCGECRGPLRMVFAMLVRTILSDGAIV
jgi:hypothetical protein